MGLMVLPYGEEHIPLVQRFNERLRNGGSRWAFYPHPVPKWLPRRPAGGPAGFPRADEPASVWREFFVVLDDAAHEVHGAYCLKPQRFRLMLPEVAVPRPRRLRPPVLPMTVNEHLPRCPARLQAPPSPGGCMMRETILRIANRQAGAASRRGFGKADDPGRLRAKSEAWRRFQR